jgi:uncharacterized protein (TIGR00297 family)
VPQQPLAWQSKLILIVVVPWTAVSLLFQVQRFFAHGPQLVLWSLGLSALLGALGLISRAGTPPAAATGALLTASMMLGAADAPFQPWRSAIIPILAFMVITSLATRFGRERKQRLGTAEDKHGRVAAQVAANLGLAALALDPWFQVWLINSGLFSARGIAPMPIVAPALAALAEAAADTVSSEIGQILGGRPFMLTTFRRVDPGTDGAISVAGTLAGVLAAAAVAATGAWALHGSSRVFLLSWTGGVFGLFFDSLLGATVEHARWLNNDAVNFLSTASAALFTLVLMAATPHTAITDF